MALGSWRRVAPIAYVAFATLIPPVSALTLASTVGYPIWDLRYGAEGTGPELCGLFPPPSREPLFYCLAVHHRDDVGFRVIDVAPNGDVQHGLVSCAGHVG